MSANPIRKWSPVEPLPDDWKKWVNPELHGLVDEWNDQRTELESKNEYRTFLDRLRRQWAIETGVLERLYSIGEAPTKTLIEQGLHAALLSHGDTPGKEPSDVVAMIKDQHAAIEGLYDFVGGSKSLTTFYIRQLHSVLTQHQPTYEAVSVLGQSLQKPMIRGAWKEETNLIEGQIEFCPPDRVEAEMEKLLQWHTSYEKDGVAPEVLSAWLHHRFILIHPFVDGNGRVARCLATLVLLKPRWFPLVVTRDDKANYIGGLRSADSGDLGPLIKLFGDLQARAIREAFSLSEEIVESGEAISDILTKVTGKWETERAHQNQKVFATGDALNDIASKRLVDLANQISAHIKKWGDDYTAVRLQARRNDPKANYYGYQIGQGAKLLRFFANPRSFQSWVAVDIFTKNRTEILFAIRGMGNASGTLACLAIVFTRQQGSEDQPQIPGEVRLLSEAPFVFTHSQDPHDVATRFQKWLEACLVRGVDEWRRIEGA